MMWGKKGWASLIALGLVGALGLSLIRGQERPREVGDSSARPEPARNESRLDFSKLPPLQQQMALCAQRGADWLCRANRPDGRFVPGYLPALRAELDGDHYLRQVGAAIALARAARYTRSERQAAIARQAILTLLLDTAPDPKDARIRSTTLPAVFVNRVAAAGLLAAAIHELPSPGEDLLEQSEQLCRFIAGQQKPDGSLNIDEAAAENTAAPSADALDFYPGQALYGLARSQRTRPASWKVEVLRKSLPYYAAWWREHRSMAFLSGYAGAYAEAYLLTRDPSFSGFVTEMADWLCGLQYTQLDPRHPLWTGGFMSWEAGKPLAGEPRVISASFAEGLAEACRVARRSGDAAHYRRYREALERALQFVVTLQYTDANTQHFADWYRPTLVGGFHASHQDGNLRLDYTQHAVGALVLYLSEVADESAR